MMAGWIILPSSLRPWEPSRLSSSLPVRAAFGPGDDLIGRALAADTQSEASAWAKLC